MICPFPLVCSCFISLFSACFLVMSPDELYIKVSSTSPLQKEKSMFVCVLKGKTFVANFNNLLHFRPHPSSSCSLSSSSSSNSSSPLFSSSFFSISSRCFAIYSCAFPLFNNLHEQVVLSTCSVFVMDIHSLQRW
jgi:hypothetical protein